MCVSVSVYISQTCGNQRTTSGICSCILPCLRHDLLSRCYDSLLAHELPWILLSCCTGADGITSECYCDQPLYEFKVRSLQLRGKRLTLRAVTSAPSLSLKAPNILLSLIFQTWEYRRKLQPTLGWVLGSKLKASYLHNKHFTD